MSEFGTPISHDTLRIERIVPGPIDRVWRYLTDPALRATWLAGGSSDPQAGAPIELVFRNSELTEDDDPPPEKYARHASESRLRGQVTDCEPPRLLAFTWGDSADASHVRFELDALGEDVRMVVIHSRLVTRVAMLSVAGGWHTHLDILADRMYGRPSPGFWRTIVRLEREYQDRIPPGA